MGITQLNIVIGAKQNHAHGRDQIYHCRHRGTSYIILEARDGKLRASSLIQDTAIAVHTTKGKILTFGDKFQDARPYPLEMFVEME